MNGAALDRVFRAASGRIVGALAARFRDLDLAEEAFSEACARALQRWPAEAPADPAAWLYRVAERVVMDGLRQRHVRERLAPDGPLPEPTAEEAMMDDRHIVPDERLRLIFICCHPAVAPDARAALTLRLVCGLTVTEIARAFLTAEPTLAQRLVRAKRKIAEAGVPFELPRPELWPERMEAGVGALLGHRYTVGLLRSVARLISAPRTAKMGGKRNVRFRAAPPQASPFVHRAGDRGPALIDGEYAAGLTVACCCKVLPHQASSASIDRSLSVACA